MRAKWGSLEPLLLEKVKLLQKLGPKEAVPVEGLSPHSVCGKISALKKEGRPEFQNVRVSVDVKKKIAYLWLKPKVRVVSEKQEVAAS